MFLKEIWIPPKLKKLKKVFPDAWTCTDYFVNGAYMKWQCAPKTYFASKTIYCKCTPDKMKSKFLQKIITLTLFSSLPKNKTSRFDCHFVFPLFLLQQIQTLTKGLKSHTNDERKWWVRERGGKKLYFENRFSIA